MRVDQVGEAELVRRARAELMSDVAVGGQAGEDVDVVQQGGVDDDHARPVR